MGHPRQQDLPLNHYSKAGYVFFRRYLTTAIIFWTFSKVALAAAQNPEDWRMVGPWGGTATILTVATDNQRTLLSGGEQSLLFLSRNGGDSWVLLPFPKQPLGEIAAAVVDPLNASHFLVGVSGPLKAGLFESYDMGKTWETDPVLTGLSIRALAVSPSNAQAILAGSDQGVFLSTDSGRHWARISQRDNSEMLAITTVAFGSTANTMYAGTTHLPWRTSDGGKTWVSIHKGMADDSDIFSLYPTYSFPEKVLASACSGIYVSDNAGTTWHKINSISENYRRTHAIRQDLEEPKTFYAGTTLGLLKSTNEGTTWRQLGNVQVNSLALTPAQPSHLFMALQNDGPARSSNHGESLQPINRGFVARHLAAIAWTGKELVAIEPDRDGSTAIFLSDNGGTAWKRADQVTGLDGIRLKTIVGINGGLLFGADAHDVFNSSDGGHTWTQLTRHFGCSLARPSLPEHAWSGLDGFDVKNSCSSFRINGLYSVERQTVALLFIATSEGLYVSRDKGQEWREAPVVKGMEILNIYGSSFPDGRMAVRSLSGIYSTEDYGMTWAQWRPPVPVAELRDIAFPPLSSDAPILVATARGIVSSRNRGENWSSVSSGLPLSSAEAVIYDSSANPIAHAVVAGRLYIYQNSSDTWTLAPSRIASTRIRHLWSYPDRPNRIFGISSDIGILIRDEDR